LAVGASYTLFFQVLLLHSCDMFVFFLISPFTPLVLEETSKAEGGYPISKSVRFLGSLEFVTDAGPAVERIDWGTTSGRPVALTQGACTHSGRLGCLSFFYPTPVVSTWRSRGSPFFKATQIGLRNLRLAYRRPAVADTACRFGWFDFLLTEERFERKNTARCCTSAQ
jgi:hypothetical protein